ncbi:cellulose biosynthesis protein BcsC [uncultured Cedecea sp.]|uniref:cellulose biosynthesis protein BcsC n=1 Tax=uncultured Cedecea sp. TaxID=988762 RepID=UPI002620C657|nr:cellulose biosynthesis protein BcsC [uncultured Cedecea sp.]
MNKITTTSAILISGMMGFSATAQTSQNDAALKALFDQANYWHEKAHNDRANESLNKVLMVDPNNTQALYLMSLWAQQNGNLQEASQWRTRLAKTDPNSSLLQALDNAKQLEKIPAGSLALARQQARSGNIPAAMATWHTLFSGDTPPPGLAAEYYLTKGSDNATYSEALADLQRFTAQNPGDLSARVALGKMLTWREDTRRDGIALLEQTASGNKEADDGLRQALLWLAPTANDTQSYETFIQRHPQDREVQAHYRDTLGNAAKTEGFNALNNGDNAQAQRQFEQALQSNPEDADALAGMGYLAQRSGDYQAASQYLNRSASLGGDASAERKKQADDAAFYSQLSQAQQAFKAGNVSQALTLSAPLTQAAGEQGVSAKLFRADVLRQSKDYPQAEQAFRDIISLQPQNAQARENLYYVLKEQNKTAEADTVLRTLPATVQARLQPRVVTGSPSDPLRQQGERLAAAGNTTGAIATLRRGVTRYPDDPWMRLSLARLLQKSGYDGEAATIMQPASRVGADSNALYASALFASENGFWPQAQSLLSRIPASAQSAQMRELSQRVNYNLNIATAENYLAQGNSVAAANTLKALASRPPQSPVDAGKLAKLLARSGDITSAVAVVRGNIQKGVQGNAGDYADQIAVLNQAGLTSEVQRFVSDPALQARSTPTQLADVRNGYVINEADALREQGNYAAAYDKLISALQNDPKNTDLMFAMARLYQSGKMNKEAAVVYDYLMTHDTPDQAARVGAINIALAENNLERAQKLSTGLKTDQSPDRLFLLARLAEASGNHQQALTYLRSARGRLLGMQVSGSDATPMAGGLLLADNPFIGNSPGGSLPVTHAMPWQVTQKAAEPGTVLPGIMRTDLPQDTAQNRMLRQIDDMMKTLDKTTGMWVQGGINVRGRDGESGTSKLTEARAPISWSAVPFGESRFEFTATPVVLNSGNATGDAWRRYGSNPLSNASTNILTTIKNEQKAIAAMTDEQKATYFAANPGAEALANLAPIDSSEFNLASTDGLASLRNLLGYDEGRVAQYLEASNLKPNVNQAGDVSTDSKNASGVELSMALTGDNYRADIGTTPLGQDLNTLVGGIRWAPKLTDYLSLIFTAERRAVKDSLLSYVGLEDSYSGKTWGRVTKNGGSLQLSYDDGDAGFYAGGGGYSYTGENVASNTSVNAGAGVYLRPYHDDYRQLQAGLSLSWMNYSKDLSYFTFGQGGYFSPQNYISIAFPVEYSQTFNNWKAKLGGSLGYQSYTQDGSDYFPTNKIWQQTLEGVVESGFAKEARHNGTTQNGMGYSMRAGLDYNLNKDMIIGGEVGYDTFGSYNESTAGVYFRYMLGRN